MPGVQAIPDAQRASIFYVEPERLVFPEDPAHPLYDPQRSGLPVSPERVEAFVAGAPVPVLWVCKDGDRLLVVDGRQRTKCAREGNRILRKRGQEPRPLPVLVRRYAEPAEMLADMIAANASTPEDPIALARKLNRLAESYGWPVKRLAGLIGRTEQHVRDTLRLLDASPAVQARVTRREMPARTARELARVPREKQDKVVAELERDGGEKATRGAKGLRAVRERIGRTPAPSTKTGLRSRAEVEATLDRLERTVKGASVQARAVLRWVLGDEDALGAVGLDGEEAA